jgi:hypothetical protein
MRGSNPHVLQFRNFAFKINTDGKKWTPRTIVIKPLSAKALEKIGH